MRYDPSREAVFQIGFRPAFQGESPEVAFDPGAPPDSLGNALWLSGLAHLAYHEPTTLGGEVDRLGWHLVERFQSGPTVGFVATLGSPVRAAVLSFRGSKAGWDDIRTDLDCRLRAWPEGPDGVPVHAGFARAAELAREPVERLLSALDGVPVFATGHSLGAALALLGALASTRIPHVVGFGGPRVGAEALAERFGTRSVMRYVFCCDAVTALPPELLGYRHVGVHRFLTPRCRVVDEPSTRLVKRIRRRAELRFAMRLPWFRRGSVGSRAIADHSIENYSYALQTALRGGEPDDREPDLD